MTPEEQSEWMIPVEGGGSTSPSPPSRNVAKDRDGNFVIVINGVSTTVPPGTYVVVEGRGLVRVEEAEANNLIVTRVELTDEERRRVANEATSGAGETTDPGRLREEGSDPGPPRGPTGGSPATSSPPATSEAEPADERDIDTLIQDLFPALAVWIDHPEVGPILRQAAEENWSPVRLQHAIQQTDWWRTQSDAARQWDALKETNPGEAAARLTAKSEEFRRLLISEYGLRDITPAQIEALAEMALRGGWSRQQELAAIEQSAWFLDKSQAEVEFISLAILNPEELRSRLMQQHAMVQQLALDLGASMDQAELVDLAERALRGGWSETQIRQAVTQRITLDGELHGAAASAMGDVTRIAAEYLMPLSDEAKRAWTKNIITGEASVDGFREYARDQARSRFPGLGTTLDRGITLQQWADPYRQLVAQLHGIAPDSVDFMDPKYLQMLEFSEPGSQAGHLPGEPRPMTLAEAGKYLRTHDDFWQSDGAKAQVAGLTNSLAEMFGRTA